MTRHTFSTEHVRVVVHVIKFLAVYFTCFACLESNSVDVLSCFQLPCSLDAMTLYMFTYDVSSTFLACSSDVSSHTTNSLMLGFSYGLDILSSL